MPVVDINELVKPVANKSVMRLLSVSGPSLPDAETRAKYPDQKIRASIVIEWEPLSYILDSPWGNVERQTIPVSYNLDEEQQAQVTALGFNGIPGNKLIKRTASKVAKQPFDFFLRNNTGIKIGVDENGRFVSEDVGKIVEVENVEAAFPQDVFNESTGKWDRGKSEWIKWIRIPLKQLTDYVIPEERPVRVVQADEGTATTTVASAGSTGPNVDALKAAVQTVGLAGHNSSEFADGSKAQLFIMSNGPKAPILMSSPVMAAAKNGSFVQYLVDAGAVTVDENGVIANA